MDIETTTIGNAQVSEFPEFDSPFVARAPLPVIEVQGGEHVVHYVNRAACRLLQRARHSLLGQPFAMALPGGEECLPLLSAVYETGKHMSWNFREDSSVGSVHWTYVMWPHLKDDGEPGGVLIHVTKSEDRLLDEANEARQDAERASYTKDVFLAALSHELRTPLSPVLMLASDAAMDPALSPELRADFDVIAKNVLLEVRLIDDLLDSTRMAHGKLLLEMRPVRLNDVVKDAITHVRAEIDAHQLVLDVQWGGTDPIVFGDEARLQQVFWNVLKNAIKFTPAGGRISVRTAVDAKSGTPLVEIVDTGIGITTAELPHMFDLFSQGAHATPGLAHGYGGLGLGLALARSLIQLHGGSIRAESDGRGRGSRFTIELPRVAGNVDVAPDEQSAQPALGRREPGGARILLVEDHTPTRTVLARLLTDRKHEVSTAATVAEARRRWTTEDFDLLITDIGLPDGTGHQLMEELGRSKPLKGIALSGYGTSDDIEESRRAGFVAHLTKPVRVQTLDEALSSALGS